MVLPSRYIPLARYALAELQDFRGSSDRREGGTTQEPSTGRIFPVVETPPARKLSGVFCTPVCTELDAILFAAAAAAAAGGGGGGNVIDGDDGGVDSGDSSACWWRRCCWC